MNFVIYDDKENRNEYEMIILNFIGVREEKFKIYDFDNYKNCSYARNIYIISTLDIKKALKIISEIRKNDDWKSQIIVISDLDKANSKLLINKLLILDYIDINTNYSNRLKNDLYIAYKILNRHKTLNFCLNSEITKIPYNDILYIEKNNNQNYCTIFTTNNRYEIKDTITNLEQILDSAFFMKTHRSCIVNLHNIEHYNCPQNTIYFLNGDTIDLVSRDKKQILKSKLIDEKIEII